MTQSGLMPSSLSSQSGYLFRAIAVQALCVTLLLSSRLAQQKPRGRSRPEPANGVSTGVAHAPVKHAFSRPITAGGFVDGAPVVLIDVLTRLASTSFITVPAIQRSGPSSRLGSGVALLDYDNDGWLDIYLVNGSTSRR